MHMMATQNVILVEVENMYESELRDNMIKTIFVTNSADNEDRRIFRGPPVFTIHIVAEKKYKVTMKFPKHIIADGVKCNVKVLYTRYAYTD